MILTTLVLKETNVLSVWRFMKLFYILSESESVQSGQSSVERKIHHEAVLQCFTNPGGGAVVQRRTKARGVSGDVSLCLTLLLQSELFYYLNQSNKIQPVSFIFGLNICTNLNRLFCVFYYVLLLKYADSSCSLAPCLLFSPRLLV